MIWRDAVPADAPALAAVFADSFCATFAHLYRPDDLRAFLATKTAAAFAAEIADPAFALRIGEADDGTAAGLAKLGPPALPIERPRPAIELRQLYLLAGNHGSGAAKDAMAWVLGEARRRGAEELFLSVYVDNVRAKRFYARYGFVAVGRYDFMVGSHADEDEVWRLRL
jgi:diamine N-acetyltransferase